MSLTDQSRRFGWSADKPRHFVSDLQGSKSEHQMHWHKNQIVNWIDDLQTPFYPIEVKSGQTITADYFTGLHYWQALSQQIAPAWLVYAGKLNQKRAGVTITNWQSIADLLSAISG